MNTYTEYSTKVRFTKNKNKSRFHERKIPKLNEIEKILNKKNEKQMKSIKNFKRSNNVERNPLIVESRGMFQSYDDYITWCKHNQAD